LASGSGIYDYFSAQKTALEEKQKGDRLLLSVQRGVYPLRGMSGDVTFGLKKDTPELSEYFALLTKTLPKDAKTCVPSKPRYDCGKDDDGTIGYLIKADSPLFPKQNSQAAKYLNRIGIYLEFVKLNPAGSKSQYSDAGGFYAPIDNVATSGILFNPANGHIEYDVRRFTIADTWSVKSGIYSFVEVFPGFVATAPAILDQSICETCLRLANEGNDPKLSVKELFLRFPYPKGLHFIDSEDFVCDSSERGHQEIRMLPDDIEYLDEIGNVRVKIEPERYKDSLCKALTDPGF
jgi:hypothetical protein